MHSASNPGQLKEGELTGKRDAHGLKAEEAVEFLVLGVFFEEFDAFGISIGLVVGEPDDLVVCLGPVLKAQAVVLGHFGLVRLVGGVAVGVREEVHEKSRICGRVVNVVTSVVSVPFACFREAERSHALSVKTIRSEEVDDAEFELRPRRQSSQHLKIEPVHVSFGVDIRIED